MDVKRWGIQQRVMVFLFLAVVLSSLAVGLVVAWSANREFGRTAEQNIDTMQVYLRERFRTFDLLLAEQEKALDERLEHILPETVAALEARNEDPSGTPVSFLNTLCRRYGYDHLYIIDSRGVVVNTNFAPDLGLDLSNVGSNTEAMLQRLYGSGEVFSDRFNVSIQTGVLRKYAYYSPPGADYILEASFGLRKYVERQSGTRLAEFIFDEQFHLPGTANDRVRALDAFIANDFASWSLTKSGATLPADIREAFVFESVDEVRREKGDRIVVYERYPRIGGASGQNESLITKVAYDIGPRRQLLQRIFFMAAALAAVFGLLAFLLAASFFQRWLIKPVRTIADRLGEVAQGRFRPLKTTGVPELDVITRGINDMQQEIEQRQADLIRTNEMLETRVRERTAELQALNEDLSRLADTDALTEVATRRVFFERGAVELARIKRMGTPLSAALMDIDHFKSVNDSFGHEMGDRVLKALGEILKDELRKTDVAARLGGEEFGLLLVGSDVNTAREVLERIRSRIAGTVVRTGEEKTSVTVSIGLVECVESDDMISALRRADKSLYEAKRTGRNRIATLGNT